MTKVYILKMDLFDWPHETVDVAAFNSETEATQTLHKYQDQQNEPDEDGYVSPCMDYYYISEMDIKE